MLVPLRHIQAVEPGPFRGAGAVKKQDIGGDGGVGGEHAAGHADDRMQIELTQQLFLDMWFFIILYRYYIQQAVYIFSLSL